MHTCNWIWLLKVQTNLNCHGREEHVKGHRGETIPEDENSYESYFDCHHKRLHVCWIIVLENELTDLDTHVWGPNVLHFTTKWSRISNAGICQYWQWSMKLTSSRMSWGSQNRWRSLREHLETLKKRHQLEIQFSSQRNALKSNWNRLIQTSEGPPF